MIPFPFLLTSLFTARRLAKRGICRRRVSVRLCVCVCVSVTPVSYTHLTLPTIYSV